MKKFYRDRNLFRGGGAVAQFFVFSSKPGIYIVEKTQNPKMKMKVKVKETLYLPK